MTWYFATRDIRKQVQLGQIRFKWSLLHTSTSEALRCILQVKLAVEQKEWRFASIKMDDMMSHVDRLSENKLFENAELENIRAVRNDGAKIRESIEQLLRKKMLSLNSASKNKSRYERQPRSCTQSKE